MDRAAGPGRTDTGDRARLGQVSVWERALRLGLRRRIAKADRDQGSGVRVVTLRRRRGGDESGIALLVVLLTITLLTIVVIEFTDSADQNTTTQPAASMEAAVSAS